MADRWTCMLCGAELPLLTPDDVDFGKGHGEKCPRSIEARRAREAEHDMPPPLPEVETIEPGLLIYPKSALKHDERRHCNRCLREDTLHGDAGYVIEDGEGTRRFYCESFILCDCVATSTPGKKFDTGKLPWALVPWRAFEQVVHVLNHGVKKYSAWNWVKVEPFRERYFSAAMRHLVAWRNGETNDPESGLPHLAHAICCCLFLIGREIGDTGPAEQEP